MGNVTLGLKNHFGSVSFTEDAGGSDTTHGYSSFYKILGDISNNPVFRNKTRLVLGDGIMGHPTSNTGGVSRFASFGNKPPETLFFGADPVAVDSVMYDYLQWEVSSHNDKVHRYAAGLGLGVLEHWNTSTDRSYSVIDYEEVDLDLDITAPSAPGNLRVVK